MLSIAFSASIGGVATLIGTPPNLILAANIQEEFQIELGFFGCKLGCLFRCCCFNLLVYLTKIAYNFSDEQNQFTTVKEELIKLGAMSVEEKRVLTIFILTALGWISEATCKISSHN